MNESSAPQLYLVTPSVDDARMIAAALAAALDAVPVAAVLVRLADAAESDLVGRIKTIAPAVQNAGAALLIDGRTELVGRTGADGAHLAGFDALSAALPSLKPNRIAGCGGLASRDDAMRAGEAGARHGVFGGAGAGRRRPALAGAA